MRRFGSVIARLLVGGMLLGGGTAVAQRHSMGVAPPTPPTIPPAKALAPAPVVRPPAAAMHVAAVSGGPVAPVSMGMGAIQFLPANAGVPAPQTLIRQLYVDDERTRLGALSSMGAPGQYLARGHVPFPHSVQLDMVQLSRTEDLDALLTVELDQHVVSAVLVPEGNGWHRVATLSFASSFSAGMTTPSNFVRPLRSWLEPDRYRAVFHATVNGANGDFTENEADLRVINGRAAVVMSFVSGARQCDTTGQLRPPHQFCELIQRWLEPEPADPSHHLTLITGLGHISAHEADDPLSRSRNYRLTRLRAFSCQPFVFVDAGTRFEPTANSAPCAVHEQGAPAHAERQGVEPRQGPEPHPGPEPRQGPEHGAEHLNAEHLNAEHLNTEHLNAEHSGPEHAEHP